MKRSKANGCAVVEHKCLKMLKTVTKKLLKAEDALETKPEIIAAGCPFCTMMTPMVLKEKKVMDRAYCRQVLE
jgi:Fe-S oxidoreductase